MADYRLVAREGPTGREGEQTSLLQELEERRARLRDSEPREAALRELAAQLVSAGEALDPGSRVAEDCRHLCHQLQEVRGCLGEAALRLEGRLPDSVLPVVGTPSSDKSSSGTSEDCDTIEDTVVLQSQDSEEEEEAITGTSEVLEEGSSDTVYLSSPTSSLTGPNVFSSSTSGPPPPCLRSEAFLAVAAVEEEVKEKEAAMDREPCKLEMDISAGLELLEQPLSLQDSPHLEDTCTSLLRHAKQLADLFVPANVSEEEAGCLVARGAQVRERLAKREEEVRQLASNLAQWREELGGLTLWMKEVEVFLHAEEAALGDMATLEAQLKESNALQDDIETLQPNVENINETGETLAAQCEDSSQFQAELRHQLETVNTAWEATVSTARQQNYQLVTALDTSREVTEMMREINMFLDQLEGDLEGCGARQPVTAAPELSQRTYKLLQLRDRTERKGEVLQRLSLVEVEQMGRQGGDLGARISAVQERWSEVTAPVHSSYSKMREATTDYGEFKTLVAQESDWLDRLEKKLRRSSKAAADAEEISEELDDIENCLHNHPEERITRLRELSLGLGEKDILISPVQTEADKLAERWVGLGRQARERIRSLEECIQEAQEWECKILCVQDWLAEKDMLLTSHLEHELTVEDLADETQVRPSGWFALSCLPLSGLLWSLFSDCILSALVGRLHQLVDGRCAFRTSVGRIQKWTSAAFCAFIFCTLFALLTKSAFLHLHVGGRSVCLLLCLLCVPPPTNPLLTMSAVPPPSNLCCCSRR